MGALYDKKYGFLFDRDKSFELGLLAMMMNKRFGYEDNTQEKINKILDEYDKPYNEGMKLFANHSDCDGEFTPDECVLILKSFGRVDPDKFDNSDEEDNKWFRESYVIWQKMMIYAIENNKSILFG